MAEYAERKLKFIQEVLPELILKSNEDLKGQSIVSCTAFANTQLDGFMSAIYSVNLLLKNRITGR